MERHGRRAPRSPVPDLLFEDIQAERVADLAQLIDQPDEVDERTALHRVTLFATYGCNLACPYCKTIARTEEELAARTTIEAVHDDRYLITLRLNVSR